MLDTNPELSICQEATRTFPGQPGLMIRDSDGRPFPAKICYASDRARGNSLELVFADQTGTLSYTASLLIDPITHVIEASASLASSRPM